LYSYYLIFKYHHFPSKTHPAAPCKFRHHKLHRNKSLNIVMRTRNFSF